MKVLVLNAGSSSHKCSIFDFDRTILNQDMNVILPRLPIWKTSIDWTKFNDGVQLKITNDKGIEETKKISVNDRLTGIASVITSSWEGKAKVLDSPSEIAIVGHRVVHGGNEYVQPVKISPIVKKAIESLSTLAPEHNPPSLLAINAAESVLGTTIPQLAVFDTAFHAGLPQVAAVYPGPYQWFESGIKRFGFHGINHEYCASQTAGILNKDLKELKLITCHLGNGCSLAAISGGKSIDTTMGFTPMEGLMMGSRSGSIDPGILFYLLNTKKYDVIELNRILNEQSGLKGISGISNDMRQIVASRSSNPRAELAFSIFVYRLRAYIGYLLANLGGLNALVFSGGIGENSSLVRAAVCESLAFWNITLDQEKNEKCVGDEDISSTNSLVRVVVIKAKEDWAIACACQTYLESCVAD